MMIKQKSKCRLLSLPLIMGALLASGSALHAQAVAETVVEAPIAEQSEFSRLTGKKLLEYGQDVPRAQFVRDNIREMEKRPFDGVIMRPFFGSGQIFNTKVWVDHKDLIQGQLKTFEEIKWGRFTDNFVAMYAASTMDWFNDDDWKNVLGHVQFCARAARVSKCKGLVFDPEPYGFSPWDYARQKDADKISFEVYSAKAQQRGREFMRAITAEFPEARLLLFYQYSMFYGVSHDPDVEKRQELLKRTDKAYNYPLMLPFLNGILEEATANVQLIDGNEYSYGNRSATDFYQQYWTMRQGGRINVPDVLKSKYDTHVRAANALYVDHLFGMRKNLEVSSIMTPEERQRWFEHNVYYALKAADEYVWAYSEDMNWWTDTNVPPGIEKAILSAKQKLQEGQELGFELTDFFKDAEARLEKSKLSQLQKKERRSAQLVRLHEGQAPKIDGKLDEAVYREFPWLEPMLGFSTPQGPQPLKAATRVWASYDADHLYLSVHCDEPNMAAQQVANKNEKREAWEGESVDISILKPGQSAEDAGAQYYHLILNPDNARWEGIDGGKKPTGQPFKPTWQSATARDEKGWTAEIAIPWKEIGIEAVNPGLKIHGNVARQRVADEREYSSWSQCVIGFQEPQNFGTWTLG
jgi:hypothetical protein